MTYKILREVPDGLHNNLVLESVNEKPDVKTVIWFSKTDNDGLIPHVSIESRVARAHSGVVNTKFRETQYTLFKQYYSLTDNDDVPYKHPYGSMIGDKTNEI